MALQPTQQDVEQWADEVAAVGKRIGRHFARSEPRQRAVAYLRGLLGDTGRILLRPSGTEPLVRVMVEAADEDTAQSIAEHLAQVVRTELALELVTD